MKEEGKETGRISGGGKHAKDKEEMRQTDRGEATGQAETKSEKWEDADQRHRTVFCFCFYFLFSC